MEEPRTELMVLDTNTKSRLCMLGSGQGRDLGFEETRQLLPDSLTVEEVKTVEVSISSYAEQVNPSRDAVSGGRRVAERALMTMGHAAIIGGDIVTAESIIDVFREDRLAITRRVTAWHLSRTLKKRLAGEDILVKRKLSSP